MVAKSWTNGLNFSSGQKYFFLHISYLSRYLIFDNFIEKFEEIDYLQFFNQQRGFPSKGLAFLKLNFEPRQFKT